MKEQIITYLNEPVRMERLYRANKTHFKREFNSIYTGIKGNPAADFWNARLNYEADEINWGTRRELFVVITGAIMAGFIAKLPALFSIAEDFFYPRNIGFIVFPVLSAFFVWKNRLPGAKIAVIGGLILAGLIFINCFPDIKKSDTLILSCIHLPLFLWSVTGFAFVGDIRNNDEKRLGYLRYNGDLIVMTTLILIAGAIMTGITIGLFELIGLTIKDFYFEYVVVFGLSAAPVLGTYLIQINPQLVNKVSPVIAKIFSPLVLVTLLVYLIAIIYSGKDPYNDREFLLIFNALLIGVMAIIFFSVAELSKTRSRAESWLLFVLAVVTIMVNGIALSAIIFRIAEWGITPNRAAVFGSNLLILINLLFVTVQLFRVVFKRKDIAVVGKAIAFFLPFYFIWTILVTFIFPLLFGFR